MFENASFVVIDKDNIGLAGKFSVNPDSCGNAGFYREYLQYSALSDLYSGRNTTHLFIDEDESRIIGFVSLRTSAVISSSSDGGMTGEPAIEVSVLAVDRDYEGRGAGRMLIDYVITQAYEMHQNCAGVRYIVLAADKKAVGFYKHLSFARVDDQWYRIPKENWSEECVPMTLLLEFEKNYIETFIDDDDEE